DCDLQSGAYFRAVEPYQLQRYRQTLVFSTNADAGGDGWIADDPERRVVPQCAGQYHGRGDRLGDRGAALRTTGYFDGEPKICRSVSRTDCRFRALPAGERDDPAAHPLHWHRH